MRSKNTGEFLHRYQKALRTVRVVALTEQRYGSGKVAFGVGDNLLLEVGAGICYIYPQDASAEDRLHGTGLLYTYRHGDTVSVDERKLNI